MPKVSTRSRSGATTVTRAATAVAKPDSPVRAAASIANEARTRIAKVVSAIRDADEKIEMAVDASEIGQSIHTLLDHIAHGLMIGEVFAIDGEAPTKADAAATYDALFTPLAALDAAISLARGSIIEHTLREAWQVLDWAQTECNSQSIGMLLPHQTSSERNFLRGRDHAVKMIEEGRSLGAEASSRRLHRDGKAQDNFFKGWLADVIEDQSLVDGFAAVLSAYISDEEPLDVPYYAASMAEYMAGDIGADGTEVDITATLAPSSASESPCDRLTDAFSVFDCAEAIVAARASELQDDLTNGVRSLAAHLHPRFSEMCSDRALTEDKCNPISSDLSVIDGVLDAACNQTDDRSLWGALNLVRQSKVIVDGLIDDLMAAERRPA